MNTRTSETQPPALMMAFFALLSMSSVVAGVAGVLASGWALWKHPEALRAPWEGWPAFLAFALMSLQISAPLSSFFWRELMRRTSMGATVADEHVPPVRIRALDQADVHEHPSHSI